MAAATSPKWVQYTKLIILGPIVLPAMWVMAYLYPIWEKWIKENGDLKSNITRLVLILPLTVLVVLALIIYNTLHKPFEDAIGTLFGKKLF